MERRSPVPRPRRLVINSVELHRRELGMTRAALAVVAGVHESTVRAIERGHVPTAPVASSVAQALEKSVQDLGLENVSASRLEQLQALSPGHLLRHVNDLLHRQGSVRTSDLSEKAFQRIVDEHDWSRA
jgi:DNA-binding XRE family transcriptional regulator